MPETPNRHAFPCIRGARLGKRCRRPCPDVFEWCDQCGPALPAAYRAAEDNAAEVERMRIEDDDDRLAAWQEDHPNPTPEAGVPEPNDDTPQPPHGGK